jgi:hypothetical protein
MVFKQESENVQGPFVGKSKKTFMARVRIRFIERHFPHRNIGFELGNVGHVEKPVDRERSRLHGCPGSDSLPSKPASNDSRQRVDAHSQNKKKSRSNAKDSPSKEKW